MKTRTWWLGCCLWWLAASGCGQDQRHMSSVLRAHGRRLGTGNRDARWRRGRRRHPSVICEVRSSESRCVIKL